MAHIRPICMLQHMACVYMHRATRPAIRGLHQTERTLLCRWMVYSRATTSSMALRPGPCLPAEGLLDLAWFGIVTAGGLAVIVG